MQSLIYLDWLDSSFWGWAYLLFFVLVIAIGFYVLLRFTNIKDKITRQPYSKGHVSRSRQVSTIKEQGSSGFNYQELKRRVDKLEKEQDVLGEHLSKTQKVLSDMQVEMGQLRQRLGLRSPNYRESQTVQYRQEDRQLSSGSTQRRFDNDYDTRGHYSKFLEHNRVTTAYSEVVDLYNSSRHDQASRERFRDKYRPFFISIANDVERRRQNLPPDFRRASNGSYLAVPQGSDKAVVFPDFTLVIVDGVYEAGALGEAFDCPNYERSFSYPNFSVVEPAVFNLNGGDSWSVEKKGMIELGQGQGG
jgi:hypothetical protein